MNEIISTETKLSILEKAGVTREKGAKVIFDAMGATKMTIDKFGDEHTEPDHTIRLRAEELRARYTGDIKPDGTTVTNNTITITASQFKELLEADRKVRPTGQSGEIIDVVNYRA